jgi:hypothetical protein
MATLSHGTIIIGVKTSSAIIVGSDLAETVINSQNQRFLRRAEKIVYRPDLPIAAAIGNLSSLFLEDPSISDSCPIRTLITEKVFARLQRRDDLSIDNLYSLVERELYPIIEKQAAFLTRMKLTFLEYIDIYFLLFANDIPKIYLFTFDIFKGKTMPQPIEKDEAFSCPDSVKEYYGLDSQGSALAMRGFTFPSPRDWANHIGALIMCGIQIEQVKYDGQNYECGLGAQVVIVFPDKPQSLEYP